MDKKTIKQIVAREGLIVLGMILLAFSIFFISSSFPKMAYEKTPSFLTPQEFKEARDAGLTAEEIFRQYHERKQSEPKAKKTRFLIRFYGFILIFCAYPFYLLIRFIIWAIKTLREK